MSWTDRFAEFYELLAGLGVAVGVLAFIAWLFGLAGSSGQRGDDSDRGPASREAPLDQGPTEGQEQPVPGSHTEENPGRPVVAALYIAPNAGRPMERVNRVTAVAGRGLDGDRYLLEKGHWSGTDECEVTIIAQEDIDEIERRSGLRIQNGEHRRNLVIRNLPIEHLTGRRFIIGSAIFGYERPRPPCAYIQLITEPGMTKALGRRAGICVRCIKSGEIQEGDRIVILQVTLLQALKYRGRLMLRSWQSNSRTHG